MPCHGRSNCRAPSRHVTRRAAVAHPFRPANGIRNARRRPGRYHALLHSERHRQKWQQNTAGVASVFRVYLRLAAAAAAAGTLLASYYCSSQPASMARTYVPSHVALHPSGMSGTAGASRPSVPSRCNRSREHASPSRARLESGLARPASRTGRPDHSLRGNAARDREGRCGHYKRQPAVSEPGERPP